MGRFVQKWASVTSPSGTAADNLDLSDGFFVPSRGRAHVGGELLLGRDFGHLEGFHDVVGESGFSQ